MKVVVLAGGLSNERDVSISSGSQIANALTRSGHQALLMDAFFGFPDAKNFDEAFLKYGQEVYEAKVPKTAPDLKKLQADHPELTNLIGPNFIEICQSADAVFLALHGGIGENGQVQALFDLYHIPYTGTGYKASANAMDKLISKKLCILEGITTPNYWVHHEGEDLETLEQRVTFPNVVKPLDNGSSIGIRILEDATDFKEAVKDALQYSKKVLIEEKVTGREFSVGLLDGKAVPIIEIIPLKGFYDYSNKYQAGATKEVTPAELSQEKTLEMQQIAEKAYEVLELHGYSRVDFMMAEDGTIQFIEANTLPGMTPTSLLPQEAKVVGIEYDDLCEMLLKSAFNR